MDALWSRPQDAHDRESVSSPLPFFEKRQRRCFLPDLIEVRIMLKHRLWNPDFFPLQFRFYFQRVANRLAAVMVVGDDESCLGLFGDQFGSFADLEELEFVVEIIIPGIPPRPSRNQSLAFLPCRRRYPGGLVTFFVGSRE